MMLRRVAGAAAAGLAVLSLSACESTAEQSARLAKHAGKLAAGSKVRVTASDASVVVVGATALQDVNGAAAAVALRNTTNTPLYNLPISVTAVDAAGAKVGANDTAGLDPSLTHVSVLAPGAVTYWVDDALVASGKPARATARVGRPAGAGPASAPVFALSGAKLTNDPSSGILASGTVRNGTSVAQPVVTVEAVSLRKGKIIAAGRGAVMGLGPGRSAPFRVFFIGNPTGGQLVLSAAPSKLG